MEKLDCIVVGAGVIGLAIAAQLAEQGREVIVFEAESHPGMHASSRNSGVIHAGTYYSPGSQKARFCVEGQRRLYEYCRRRSVAHRDIGKLITASGDEQLTWLKKYFANALTNGVDDLKRVTGAGVSSMEPDVTADAAIWSPRTGIIDTHELMQALQADLEMRGGHVLCEHEVTGGSVEGDDIELEVNGGDFNVSSAAVVNAGGFLAVDVAQSIRGINAQAIPHRRTHVKSHYFRLSGKSPFNCLIYPVAPPGTAGIHSVMSLDGRIGFGPDHVEQETADYAFDETRRDVFAKEIATWYPGIEAEKLQPDFCGVSASLQTEAGPVQDFMISRAGKRGAATYFWNLFAMDSPALTSSLAIANHVATRLNDSLND